MRLLLIAAGLCGLVAVADLPGARAEETPVTTCPDGSKPYFGVCTPTTDDSKETILNFAPSTMSTGDFDMEVRPCVQRGKALDCTIWVTPKRGLPWYFNNESHLVDDDGGLIPVDAMTIGSETITTTGWRYQVRFMNLTAGVKTKINYHFNSVPDPTKIQAFQVALLAHKFATLTWGH